MSLGSRIKFYRSQKGFTQEELAEGICSVSYISKLENNKVTVHDEILTLICERLNINRNQIQVENELKNLKEHYDQWLQRILKKDLPSSSSCFTKLFSIHHALHEELNALSSLCQFGHNLLSNKLHEAGGQIQQILDIRERIPEKYQYYADAFCGIYFLSTEQNHSAKICFDRAIQACKEPENGELTLYKALALSKLRAFEKSNHLARKALSIFQEQLNYEGIIDCHMLFSINLNFLNEFEEAREHLAKILSINLSKEKPLLLGQVYHNLGYIYFREHHYPYAKYYFEKALLFKNKPSSQLSTRYLLAKTYREIGEHQIALNIAMNSHTVSKSCNHKRYEYKFKVLTELLRGNFEELTVILETKVIPYFMRHGSSGEYVHYLKILGEICYQLNHYRKAAFFLHLAHQVSDVRREQVETNTSQHDASGA
ncbi:MAG: helix-turn-helix transcriptional regulator [Bacillaceae bacterium]|nr:helix-turn-helix transcriptional regulator [Bacillaceae bacterium]